MYSDLYIKKRNPFFPFAFIVLSIATVAGAGYLYTSTFSPTRANAQKKVEHQIVNAAPKQMSIYWQTEENETGWVLYGDSPDSLSSVAVDDRDKGESRGKYTQHLVTIRNLQPNTQYFYKIIASNVTVTDENDSAFVMKTPKHSPPSTTAKPVYGKVTDKTGKPIEQALVKLMLENGIPMITFSKSTGEWLIPLQSVYNLQQSNTLQVNNETLLTIEITANDKNKSKVITVMGKGSPLPKAVVLGSNYDFRKEESDVLPASTSRAEEESQKPTILNEVDIEFPRPNAIIPGSQPLIKGKGIAKTRVRVELNSKPAFTLSSIVNERGDWSAYVPKPLPPGTYTMTLLAKNNQNEDVVLTRSFTLTKSGEQVLAEATGPGELSPTIDPSPTEEPPLPTVKPTGFPSPTNSYATPTVATTSPTIATVYVTPAPPVSGGNGLIYTIVSIGLLVVGGGVILLL